MNAAESEADSRYQYEPDRAEEPGGPQQLDFGLS